ncbi:hypothetical protein BDU57DRAFT_338175 [Ampelomyces quisqualis]|uniref:Uncharacterized protein n=1 Tax=Ampelomyces quisqualis TaxID=50730 RepID=A0A6A5QBH2_AMPQU|nr:hypothetical protein BDU57DRAFT_338175 [Ampelomyces quisqualis]
MKKPAVTDKYFPAEVFRRMRPYPEVLKLFKWFYRFEMDVMMPRLDPVIMMARINSKFDETDDVQQGEHGLGDAPGDDGDDVVGRESAGGNVSGMEDETVDEHDPVDENNTAAEGKAAVKGKSIVEDEAMAENDTAVEDETTAGSDSVVENQAVDEGQTIPDDQPASSNRLWTLMPPPRTYSLPTSTVPSAVSSPLPRALGHLRATGSPLAPNPSPALSNDAGETLGNLAHLTERLQVMGDQLDEGGVVPQSRFASPAFWQGTILQNRYNNFELALTRYRKHREAA